MALRLTICMLLVAAATAATAGAAAKAAPRKLRILVIAGGHGYPQEPFRAVFDRYPDMECTFVEEEAGGEAFEDIRKWRYDGVLLYNYMKALTEKQRANFLSLTRKGVGIVILHHAIYGYRPWDEWMKVVGVTSWLTGTRDDVDIEVSVSDPDHPITAGLGNFRIIDETYDGAGLDPKVRVLLKTSTSGNMPSLAWVHRYGKSPVCYLQLGHDEKAYGNESFVEVLGRAIRWSCGRLKETAPRRKAEPAGSAPGSAP